MYGLHLTVSWLTILSFGIVEGVILLSPTTNIIYSREGCHQTLVCLGDSVARPVWQKRGGTADLSSRALVETNVVEGSSPPMWKTSVVFQSLEYGDSGLLSCTFEGFSLSTTLRVSKGVMDAEMTSSVVDGQRILQCRVDTCLQDIKVLFFRESELLDSTTEPMERGWMGTHVVDSEENTAGTYVCRAMSERVNLVLHRSFHLT